jgi:hypothetical protein
VSRCPAGRVGRPTRRRWPPAATRPDLRATRRQTGSGSAQPAATGQHQRGIGGPLALRQAHPSLRLRGGQSWRPTRPGRESHLAPREVREPRKRLARRRLQDPSGRPIRHRYRRSSDRLTDRYRTAPWLDLRSRLESQHLSFQQLSREAMRDTPDQTRGRRGWSGEVPDRCLPPAPSSWNHDGKQHNSRVAGGG